MLRGTTSRLALRLTPDLRRSCSLVLSSDNHQHHRFFSSSEAPIDENRQLVGGAVRATRREFATKKEIGKGLKEDKVRPGDHSQVSTA